MVLNLEKTEREILNIAEINRKMERQEDSEMK